MGSSASSAAEDPCSTHEDINKKAKAHLKSP